MCECEKKQDAVHRRGFLGLLATGASGLIFMRSSPTNALKYDSPVRPIEVTSGLLIFPRSTWGPAMNPRHALKPEPDVKFLLVHHSAGSTTYKKEQVPRVIGNIFFYQTSSKKQFDDTTYNFFIDRFGGVWEGRKGSLDGPVMAEATGGSQGFAQLVCLLGNFEETRPTPEMIDSLGRLLGWLGSRYNIDLHQNKTVSFISRGSNKWKKGAHVTARPISGHRDMSYTTCPGKFVYPLLASQVPARSRAFVENIPKS